MNNGADRQFLPLVMTQLGGSAVAGQGAELPLLLLWLKTEVINQVPSMDVY